MSGTNIPTSPERPAPNGAIASGGRGKDPLAINTELVEKILVGFLKNEVGRVGFSKVVLGLSGGIDSTVSAYLAAKALGPKNVYAVRMPYSSSSSETMDHAALVASELGLSMSTVPITEQIDAYFELFPDASRLRRANKMARERMTILYDHSAALPALVVGTSNKTELLLGYGTIFGDMASALNPIGDLYKTQLRELAVRLGVPRAIIDKNPTADLWVGQTDEAELGFTYAEVDRLLVRMIDQRMRRQISQRRDLTLSSCPESPRWFGQATTSEGFRSLQSFRAGRLIATFAMRETGERDEPEGGGEFASPPPCGFVLLGLLVGVVAGLAGRAHLLERVSGLVEVLVLGCVVESLAGVVERIGLLFPIVFLASGRIVVRQKLGVLRDRLGALLDRLPVRLLSLQGFADFGKRALGDLSHDLFDCGRFVALGMAIGNDDRADDRENREDAQKLFHESRSAGKKDDSSIELQPRNHWHQENDHNLEAIASRKPSISTDRQVTSTPRFARSSFDFVLREWQFGCVE